MASSLQENATIITYTIMAEDYDNFGCPSCRYRPDREGELWRAETSLLTCENDFCHETFCVYVAGVAGSPFFLVNDVCLIPRKHKWHGSPRLKHPYRMLDDASREELMAEVFRLRGDYEYSQNAVDELLHALGTSNAEVVKSESELQVVRTTLGEVQNYALALEKEARWLPLIFKRRVAYVLRGILGFPT